MSQTAKVTELQAICLYLVGNRSWIFVLDEPFAHVIASQHKTSPNACKLLEKHMQWGGSAATQMHQNIANNQTAGATPCGRLSGIGESVASGRGFMVVADVFEERLYRLAIMPSVYWMQPH